MEITGIARRPDLGFMVTVLFTPGWLGKLLGHRPYTRRLYSKYTNIWYDTKTLREVSYIDDASLRRFLDEHVNETKNEVIRAIEKFDS